VKQIVPLLLVLLIGCSKPGIKYSVQVTSIDPAKEGISTYCVYHIKSTNELILPQEVMLFNCGKYKVGDTFDTEINDLK
jgi:hypothetical protein